MTVVRLVGGPLELDGLLIPDTLMPCRVVDDSEYVSHAYDVEPYQVYGQSIGTYRGLATEPEHY